MNGQINIKPVDLEKLKKVIMICNSSKRCNLELLSVQGGTISISFNSVQELFILGRVFQSYKPAVKAGSIIYHQKNNMSDI